VGSQNRIDKHVGWLILRSDLPIISRHEKEKARRSPTDTIPTAVIPNFGEPAEEQGKESRWCFATSPFQ
jgi:hypothetical protein